MLSKQVWMPWKGVSQIYPFKRQPHKMVKHTQAICQQRLTNCLSVFDHFVGLALKGLKKFFKIEPTKLFQFPTLSLGF